MMASVLRTNDLQTRAGRSQLIADFEQTGFTAVSGHGIPQELFASVRRALWKLFDVAESTKHEQAIQRGNYRGFIPLGFFTPNRTDYSGAAVDRYEGYKLHWECPPDHPVRHDCDLYGSNRWPSHVPELAALIAEYWQHCTDLSNAILDLLADSLEIPTADLRSWHQDPLTNMTLLHYPPSPGQSVEGIHPHKDTNTITFLHPGPVAGLEIRTPGGDWIDGAAPDHALVVNVGEMLELWSAGRFMATPHRVVNRTNVDRYSFPWFLVPRHDVVVEALVEGQERFQDKTMPVGALSAEVWRTNWPDEEPSTDAFDLGTLDR